MQLISNILNDLPNIISSFLYHIFFPLSLCIISVHMGTIWNEETRTSKTRYKEMRKGQIQVMNVSYERGYKANFFSSSNFVIDFVYFFLMVDQYIKCI